jgi:predicted thioesterase
MPVWCRDRSVKSELQPGVSRTVTFTVTESMCPAFDGVVVHRVCATWTLVQYMEVAGRRVLVDFLEDGEEGVGTSVRCEHVGAAPVGSVVTVTATATRVTDRELICATVAKVGDRQVATGMTGQRVFPKARLKRLLGEP